MQFRPLAQKIPSTFLVIALLVAVSTPAAGQAKKSAAAKRSTAAKPPVASPSDEWPQWGGPQRNFMTDARGLANSWPSTGPKRLWSRDLGEGYSGIAAEKDRLYTMYRVKAGAFQFGKKDQEIVIALDPASGKTLWEFSYDAPLLSRMDVEYGPGPHATPLIVGDRLFAVGATGKFHALDKATGKKLWSHDFFEEFAVTWGRGYSCSPIAYKDTVILVLGKKGRSVVAFDQKTGNIVWQNQEFDYGPGSPVLINVDGQDQLVAFMANEIVGLDPNNGDLFWRYPHKSDWGLNISTPVWGPDHLLFCSSAQAYHGGSRMLQLTRAGGKTTAKELWFSPRRGVHISNAIRIGDYIYTSVGDFGPAFFVAMNAKSGDTAWVERGLARANSVYADGKFILLDEDGTLALAQASPEGLKVISRAEVLKHNAWTAPSLAGTRLFIRDRKTIMAFDLS